MNKTNLTKELYAPGPSELIAGDTEAGYYGSLSARELGRFVGGSQYCNYVTASTLATQAGITEGTPQNEEIILHKFIYKNEILYIPQKSIRHSISWHYINSQGCVFGDKTIKIGEFEYVMTLMKGLSREGVDSFDIHESEWDNLWPLTGLSANDIGATDSGYGSWSWCQETVDSDSSEGYYRSRRGGWTLAGWGSTHASGTHSTVGWRPVLRIKCEASNERKVEDMKQETVKDTKDMTLKELVQLAKEKAQERQREKENILKNITVEIKNLSTFILENLANKLIEEVGLNLLDEQEGSLIWIINKHIATLGFISKLGRLFEIDIKNTLFSHYSDIELKLYILPEEATLKVFSSKYNFLIHHRFLYINDDGLLTYSINMEAARELSQERVKTFIGDKRISEQRALLDDLKDLNKKRQTILNEAWADLERRLKAIYLKSLEETE